MNGLSLLAFISFMGIFGMGLFRCQNSSKKKNDILTLEKELTDIYGRIVARSPGGQLAICSTGQVHLFRSEKLVRSIEVSNISDGNAVFSADESKLFLGPWEIDLESGTPKYFDLRNQFWSGIEGQRDQGQYETRWVSWAENGAEMVIFINYRPPRGLRHKGSAPYTGPGTRCLQLAGPELKPVHILQNDAGFGDRQPTLISADLIVKAGMEIHIWDRKTGDLLHEIKGDNNYISSLALSPDQSKLAVGRVNGRLDIYDTKSAEKQVSVAGLHQSRIMAVEFNRDGRLVFTGSEDNFLKVTDWKKSPKPIQEIDLKNKIEGIYYYNSQLIVSSKFTEEKVSFFRVNE